MPAASTLNIACCSEPDNPSCGTVQRASSRGRETYCLPRVRSCAVSPLSAFNLESGGAAGRAGDRTAGSRSKGAQPVSSSSSAAPDDDGGFCEPSVSRPDSIAPESPGAVDGRVRLLRRRRRLAASPPPPCALAASSPVASSAGVVTPGRYCTTFSSARARCSSKSRRLARDSRRIPWFFVSIARRVIPTTRLLSTSYLIASSSECLANRRALWALISLCF